MIIEAVFGNSPYLGNWSGHYNIVDLLLTRENAKEIAYLRQFFRR